MARSRTRISRFLSETDLTERSALLDALDDWLERLRQVNQTVPILVEGLNDVRALRKLGIEGEILHLHMGNVSIYERVKWIEARYSHVILLLDADPRGRHLRRRVIRHLESDWETYDEYRQELESLVGEFIRHIEDLARFYEHLYITVHYPRKNPS